MTLEDPFFVVKDEVCKALNKTRGLYQRWCEFQEDTGLVVATKEESDWTNTELRNALRSIEWDLEDLEETIGIVEKHPRKFRIDGAELDTRRHFIENTKQEVQCMKERLNLTKKDTDVTARQSLTGRDRTSRELSVFEENFEIVEDSVVDIEPHNHKPLGEEVSPLKMPQVVTHTSQNTRYSRLVNEADSPNSEFIGQTLAQQQMLMNHQDGQLDQIASTMGNLKHMSRQIGSEVDEQAVMLDDFGHEMEHTQSKMENTMNKIAKVMHLTNDKRQWAAIGTLSVILIVVIILYFTI